MINAPQAVLDVLSSGNFKYANLVTINLGDAYGLDSDEILYLTDCGHEISFGGNTYTPDNNLSELAGISRKASTGSDSVDIVFSVTDENLIDAIRSERYINKPTRIERVVMQDGAIVGDFAIPVRTAWGLSHSISGDIDDRSITLTIDSTLGDLDGDNGWYAVTASHTQRYPGDLIMRHSQTVMTEDQQKKYTTNFSGEIDARIKPPALPKIYGYKNVECVPICMLKHRKSHSSYRHYFTTMIYVINIGECDYVDINSLKMDDEPFDGRVVTNNKRDVGGWSVRVRTPADAAAGDLLSYEDSSDLSFWFEGMDSSEKARMTGMYGKGLTLLFVKNRNRDNWLSRPPNFSLPVRGAKLYDPRTGQTVFSRNPALQYSDYLKSTEYGAGGRGVPVTDANISELADHFDQIPDSQGNPGINSILIDVQVDTGKPIVDNMNIWMEGVRLYTSDYYGEFNIRVETKSAVNLVINEDDLNDIPDYESGEFTKRINQLTYSIKQLVADTSPEASPGDLTEVEVEATFPPDGSQIRADWLAEDGGINLFKSEQLSYVTVLEQAYYWAMVDARIARQPRTMTIKPNELSWLSEVGDVIQFSSTIMDMTDTLWRVEEVSEDEGQVEVSLKAYDDNFYTPDPDAIPDPPGEATPPTGVQLSPVSDLAIISDKDFYYLNWTPLSSENVTWYAVEIEKDGQLIVDKPRVADPPLLLPDISVGDYQATVTTIGIENESDPAVLLFTVNEPVAPTFAITVETFEVEIALSTTSYQLGGIFELKIGTVDDESLAVSKGKGTTFTILNLQPETTYYVFARTFNISGQSDWSSTSFTTLDGQKYVDIVLDDIPMEDVVDDVVDEIQDKFDVLLDKQQAIINDVNNIWQTYLVGEDVATEEQVRKTETKTLTAQVNDNVAEIERVDQVYADETSAIAQSIALLTADVQNNYASITYTNQAIANEASARATAISQLSTDVANTYATITSLNSVSSSVSGNSSAISTLQGQVGNPTTGLTATYNLAFSAEQTSDGNATSLAGIRTAVAGSDNQAQTELILQTNMDAVTNEVIGKAMLGVTTGGVFTGMAVVGGASYNGIEFRADVFKLSDSVGNPQLYWSSGQGQWIFNGGGTFSGTLNAAGGTFSGRVYVTESLSVTAGYFICSSSGGYGIHAVNNTGNGLKAEGAIGGLFYGDSQGVYGTSTGIGSSAVKGYALAASNSIGVDGQGDHAGVYGAGYNYGVEGNGNVSDFYASNTGYAPFTGSHEGLLPINHEEIIQGDIVCDKSLISIKNVSNAICEMELSSQPNQRSASGVFVNRRTLITEKVAALDNEPETAQLALIYDIIGFNSVGEGAINVCGEGGDIEIGDLITTSSIPGKGMKQLDQDSLKPYTVAQSREKIVFSSPDEVIQIACFYRCG